MNAHNDHNDGSSDNNDNNSDRSDKEEQQQEEEKQKWSLDDFRDLLLHTYCGDKVLTKSTNKNRQWTLGP